MSTVHKKHTGIKYRYDRYKKHAARRGKDFQLTLEQYTEILKGGRCYYCNMDITGETGGGLDRINNEEGYTMSNCHPCCASCNRRRSVSMDAETFKEQTILNGYWKE